jgi:hypothetical protein
MLNRLLAIMDLWLDLERTSRKYTPLRTVRVAVKDLSLDSLRITWLNTQTLVDFVPLGACRIGEVYRK